MGIRSNHARGQLSQRRNPSMHHRAGHWTTTRKDPSTASSVKFHVELVPSPMIILKINNPQPITVYRSQQATIVMYVCKRECDLCSHEMCRYTWTHQGDKSNCRNGGNIPSNIGFNDSVEASRHHVLLSLCWQRWHRRRRYPS